MINYVTNLDVNQYSGGWSGMNHFIHQQLASKLAINLVQKVDPPYRLPERLLSKVFRTVGLNGIFPAFTNARLNTISSSVHSQFDPSAKFTFFHGATPWINVELPTPYGMYMDACFGTYIKIYHKGQKFNTRQLSALYKREASFIAGSAAAFFSSEWALQDARAMYNIKSDNLHVAGLGGGIDDAEAENLPSEKYFLFVALDFIGKGGVEVVDAFGQLQKMHNGFRLKIVGQQPPAEYLQNNSIDYVGYLDKSRPAEKQKLQDLFKNAWCFVLPTVRDLTPLVLVEAGSVGCPVITTSSFGIPEIVIDQETGLLISPGTNMREELLTAMVKLCTDSELHARMKVRATTHIKENFTWNKVGEKIFKQISKYI